MRKSVKALFAFALVMFLFAGSGSILLAGDPYCPAAQKQEVQVVQPVVVAPLYLVPSAPTVQIQPLVVAQPLVVQSRSRSSRSCRSR